MNAYLDSLLAEATTLRLAHGSPYWWYRHPADCAVCRDLGRKP